MTSFINVPIHTHITRTNTNKQVPFNSTQTSQLP